MVYKTLEIHNILWFAVDNILPSEAHNRMKYINFLNILSDFIDNFF